MTPEKVDRFFKALSRYYPHPLKIVITGGTAAVLYGAPRATQDIDFELKLGRNPGAAKPGLSLEEAVERSMEEADLAVQYAEDWDRTSSIARPRLSPRPLPYKNVEKARIYLMHPFPWSIGKLTRFIESDIRDLVAVFRNKQRSLKLAPDKAVDYWGRALGESPRSSAQVLFRNHVTEFLRSRGTEIWGSGLNLERLLAAFLSRARKSLSSRPGDRHLKR